MAFASAKQNTLKVWLSGEGGDTLLEGHSRKKEKKRASCCEPSQNSQEKVKVIVENLAMEAEAAAGLGGQVRGQALGRTL